MSASSQPEQGDSMDFKPYRRKSLTLIRPYVPGEDLTKIGVNPGDTPEEGDLIARNYIDPNDQWLMKRSYFEAHLEPIE